MTLEQAKESAKAALKSLMFYKNEELSSSYSLGGKMLGYDIGDETEIGIIKTNMQLNYTDYIDWSSAIDALITKEAVASFYKSKIENSGYAKILKGALEVDLNIDPTLP